MSEQNPTHDTRHFFTVDVEDYFHVNAFERVITRESWPSQPRRLERSIPPLLELLGRHGVTGTFFTLGWVAEHMPDLVRRIAAAGHEIASHGYWHRRVTTMTPAEFRDDVRASRTVLENTIGARVSGYRAPSFSLSGNAGWAHAVLVEEGFRYDSSVFPVWRPGYGTPGAPRAPYTITTPAGPLAEFPLATMSVAGMQLPAAGGGWLRQFPLAITRGAFRQATRRGESATFYVHPWEIDPAQPRIAVDPLTRLRHYRGLSRTLGRMDTLLTAFRFGPNGASLPTS